MRTKYIVMAKETLNQHDKYLKENDAKSKAEDLALRHQGAKYYVLEILSSVKKQDFTWEDACEE